MHVHNTFKTLQVQLNDCALKLTAQEMQCCRASVADLKIDLAPLRVSSQSTINSLLGLVTSMACGRNLRNCHKVFFTCTNTQILYTMQYFPNHSAESLTT